MPPTPAAVQPQLLLGDVLRSVDEFYPLLAAVAQERGIAAGELLAAEGAFDLRMNAASISQPMGFYKNYRNGVGFEQPTWQGGKVTAGYRIGDDDFPVWYGERETNEGGEFAIGARQPFWKDRAIDKRRAEILKAQIKTRIAEPKILKAHINFAQQASYAYWTWVAMVKSEDLFADYLRVALDRDAFIAKSIAAGNLAAVERVDNRRVIASREAALVGARRKTQKAQIELSLFFRDAATFQPVLVDRSWVPRQFPEPERPQLQLIEMDIARALAASPEIYRLRLEQQKVGVEIDYSRNQLLPELDGGLYASKDVGAQTSSKGDKTPLELEAGLYFEVPLQRRTANGMVRAAESEQARWRAEERYAADFVSAKVRDAAQALDAMYRRIDLAKEAVTLAHQMEQVERRRFAAGQSNMLFVNLREVTSNDAELGLIGAYADFFFALADYRAALSINTPLIQP